MPHYYCFLFAFCLDQHLFQTICHSLFKRPDVQEIADIVRFENDMVRAEAVCDTLAKPMSDVEKQHLRRVFHRAFGVHPRGLWMYSGAPFFIVLWICR